MTQILIWANIGMGLVLAGVYLWKYLYHTPVHKTDFSGLKEYKTKTGVSLYCLQGGGQSESVKMKRYGII